MQSVKVSGLDRLLDDWDRLLRDLPGMKRELLEKLGGEMLEQVRRELGGTGTVQGWQERYVGSGNGYVAVRPRAGTYKTTAGGKRYAVGYVTNAIESGHRHPRPSQQHRDGYRYRARIHTPSVPGRHFYAAVRGRLEDMAQKDVRAAAAELARRLEGGV